MSDNKGLIFDIQRFSTTDGPGIRTVVFLKGCSMQCFWCHNPEGINAEEELEYNKSRCINCGQCIEVCPQHAHFYTEEGLHEFDRSKCNLCMLCVEECDAGALRKVGKEYTIEECFSEIAEDIPFYKRSGGGVTLSGGEPLLQAGYIKKLLKRCKEEGIHTAIESNLSLPWNSLQTILPYVDLVMVDIKHMDNHKHIEGTECSNQKILENLKMLNNQQVQLIVRTPVIPGFNDTRENISQTVDFLYGMQNLMYYELLSYNALGCEKAPRIGAEQRKLLPLKKGKLYELASIACNKKFLVRINGRKYCTNKGE